MGYGRDKRNFCAVSCRYAKVKSKCRHKNHQSHRLFRHWYIKKHNPFREEVATDVCSVARQFGISQQKGLSKVALLRFCELLNFCKLLCISTLMFRDHQPRQRNSTSQGKSRDGKTVWTHYNLLNWNSMIYSILPTWSSWSASMRLPSMTVRSTSGSASLSRSSRHNTVICSELDSFHLLRVKAAALHPAPGCGRFPTP